jgi:DNA polymerase IV
MARCIVHADLDAFYASVEQRDDPSLRGRPVVVGGSPEHRGVVAAASYEARTYGIRSAMAMSRALRLCPEAVRRPARFPVYAQVSATVLDGYRALSPLVEPLALDEAYMDLSEVVSADADLRRFGEQMKADVRASVGLTVSIGIAGSKSVAKIASDLEKPDGLVVVSPGTEREFLAPLPAGRLWGVGPRGEERLRRLGVTTIGELAGVDVRLLSNMFGRWGALLHDLANGVDERPVQPSREPKSVAREVTFPEDVESETALREALEELAGGVAERLQRRGLRGRTVTLKLRLADFTTLTRQRTLPYPIDDVGALRAAALESLRSEILPGRRFRLIGVAVSGMESLGQLQLPLFTDRVEGFDTPPNSTFDASSR